MKRGAMLRTRWLVPSALICALAGGCWSGGGDPASPDYFGTTSPRHGVDELWVNNGSEPQWIDPGKCSDSNGGEVIWNTFAGLVEADPKTLEAIPDIATDWEISDAGTTYTFHLRESTWSDGKWLTADDFAWSFRRLLDPVTASKYASNGYILQHGDAFSQRALHLREVGPEITEVEIRDWFEQTISDDVTLLRVKLDRERQWAFLFVTAANQEGSVDHPTLLGQLANTPLAGTKVTPEIAGPDVVGVEATGDHELVVRLENPIPYFLNFLTFYSFMPVPRHVIERLQRDGLNTDLWTRPEYIVSNGAYCLTEWKFRQYMLFTKNDRYWNADAVHIKKIKALMIESYNTALNMYRAGEIDFPGGNSSLPSEFIDHLRRYKDFHHAPYLAEYFYWMNTTRPPLDNRHLRRALSLAIDRKLLVDKVTRGNQIPTQDLVPDRLAGYDGLKRTVFDPVAARVELEAAGYARGADVPPIELIYNTSEGHRQLAEAVQQMWKEHLGVEVAISNLEWKVYLGKLERTDFQIARMGWIGDYADPYTFLELLTTTCGNNHSNWSNAEYDGLIRKANQILDPTARLAVMRQAEELAMAEQPLLPIYVYTKSQMIKPFVRGVTPNYQDRHLWKYLSIDTEGG